MIPSIEAAVFLHELAVFNLVYSTGYGKLSKKS